MASSVYAAGEGDGDGIPWDKPLNLVYILNAPAVVRINCWKDVGLELGVEKHVLDRIDRDCRGLTNDCKREMFNYWLNNDFQPSWEKVSHAVKEVRRRLDGTSHQLSSTCASTTVNVFGKHLSFIPSSPYSYSVCLHYLISCSICKYGEGGAWFTQTSPKCSDVLTLFTYHLLVLDIHSTTKGLVIHRPNTH